MSGDAWSRRFLDRLTVLGLLPDLPDPEPGAAVPPSVSQLTVAAGSVGARVAGSDGRGGYDVWVELPAFEARQWARAEQALAAHRGAREALLDGEVPVRVEGVLARAGLSLLPARAEDLTLECSCPTWARCDHLTAVLTALAAAFDADPFLLLVWRGRSRVRLLRHLKELHAAGVGADPAELPAEEDVRPLSERLADFWSEGERHRALQAGANPLPAAEPAPALLSASGVLIRGRTLESLLQAAYDALMDE
jgi:uncharacterized Zn finger protein